VWVVLAAGLLVAADDAGARKDQELIQGGWTLDSAQRAGKPVDLATEQHIPQQFVFAGDKVTLKGNGRTQEGTFKLGADQAARSITLTPKEGDRSIMAAYQLEGDTLKLCVDEANLRERPKEVASKEGTRLVVAVFKRAKK
jgi:uncharacterized protein (TIGR03067 family)